MAHELEATFRELGISQYLDAFVDQGFDTWDTILDIQESDLDALGVKLGHRRKLQRRIANARGLAPSISLSNKQNTNDGKREGSRAACDRSEPGADGSTAVKRKYRRHPKPDENAPERPPSAYVLFSNKMRDDLKGHNLTFTEIAKLVGENWQSLPPHDKEAYESQANAAKEKYHRDLAQYKKTPEYRKYQVYLQDFKEKQAKQSQDANKRSRVEPTRLRHGSTSSSAATGTTMSSSSGISTRGSGSSSERINGSEPPPTRQERVNSLGSMSHNGHEMQPSPRTANFDFNTPNGRNGGRQNLPSLSDMLEDGETAVLPAPGSGSGYTTSGFVPANGRRPMPEAHRVPLLRHQQSSTDSSVSAGSTSSMSSYGRASGDGSLPIHALLSNRSGAAHPPMPDHNSSPTFSTASSPTYTAGPRGYGFQSAPSALQHLKIEEANGGDVVMTSPTPSGAAPKDSGKDNLDGMSALLRAGEIVGRRTSD
ncbi:High mobility group protein 20A [Emericellopsis cladophorae]|uniref:High mobility group protein 20A n=1 Tax=Emericellopsis cladophorae TaxID=2686198 RepID=A0A9P9Y9H3_9HYPO|nr:High mobility group protein 20A [Emericellopsis cladophorae]KAI6785558.1 High mobility group protein 20A [Emericellopsis cladophorae]